MIERLLVETGRGWGELQEVTKRNNLLVMSRNVLNFLLQLGQSLECSLESLPQHVACSGSFATKWQIMQNK